ncbi:MAG: DUF3786 domain-containing protein [Deltaproteobacteria bacterium]|jgi:hypothetical protein|nr:DUF3786 domain-containing protein [Deltaproteobacteria bacterium]
MTAPDPSKNAWEDFSRHPFWEDLKALDPAVVAEKSGASFREEDGGIAYAVDFMGGEYELRTSDSSARSPLGRAELAYYPKIVLLAYLVKSATGPAPGLAGKEVGPQSLPWGDLFFTGPHELPKKQLADAFGSDPGALARASEALGAASRSGLAWKARLLPYVEVYWYLDPPDDEFPAGARFNFDGNICYYLTLDMIFGLTNYLADCLVSLKGA